jgi:hypothetical protein
VPLLRRVLRGHVVLDWDAYIPAASELAARDVRHSPRTWPSYRRLIRAVIDTISPAPLVVLGVCTPDELEGWPIDAWMLLDCSDEERKRRLVASRDSTEINAVLRDAARYRTLGLSVVDTTDRSPRTIADTLAHLIGQSQS